MNISAPGPKAPEAYERLSCVSSEVTLFSGIPFKCIWPARLMKIVFFKVVFLEDVFDKGLPGIPPAAGRGFANHLVLILFRIDLL